MDIFLLIVRLALAAVFGVAGMAKLFDPAGSRRALDDFGVPKSFARPLVSLLPAFELLVAVSLIFVSSSWFAAAGAGTMLAIFTAAMLYQIAKGNAPDCHCFGQLHSEPVGVTSVLRNVALIGLAGFLIFRGQNAQGVSLVNSSQDILTAVVGIALIILVGASILSLKRISDQQTQIMRRIELMELVARDGGSVERDDVSHPHEGLPIGAFVPDFALPNIGGDIVSLADVRRENLPTLFIFVGPNCTPCRSLVPEFEEWLKELAGKVKFVFVSTGKAVVNAEKFGDAVSADLLLQKGREFAELVKAKWTPTAVLMDANGRVASHVAAGDTAIRSLVERVGTEDLNREFPFFANGDGHSHAMKIGEKVPEFSISDVSGNEITPEYFQDKQTLVAFWSVTCGYCDQMLDELREWDSSRRVGEPGLIVFSDGHKEGIEALGLRSPVVIDEGHKTAEGFGMFGTPSAVLVNKDGIIVSETAIGAPDIWALVGKRR